MNQPQNNGRGEADGSGVGAVTDGPTMTYITGKAAGYATIYDNKFCCMCDHNMESMYPEIPSLGRVYKGLIPTGEWNNYKKWPSCWLDPAYASQERG